MLIVMLINILILAGAAACLVVYISSADLRIIRTVSRALTAVFGAGIAGAAICTFFISSISSVLVISGAALFFLAVLMLCFAVGRGGRAAVMRLCLAPMWSMLTVLTAYAASAICDDAAVCVFGCFAALIMCLSPACDFYRLFRRMKEDGSIAEQRINSAKNRRAAYDARKNTVEKRKKLMGKKRRK